MKSEFVLNAMGGLAARYIRLVHSTSRVVNEPADLEQRVARLQPVIYAMWHGQFMMIPKLKPASVPVRSMVARHGDAELMGRALAHFNTELIRGAGAGRKRKDKGGVHALRAAVQSLQEGVSVAMTADVPPGPARVAGLGVVSLARLSGRPIIPSAVASSRFAAFNTWSRFTVNLPFSKIACVMGDPIYVSEDAERRSAGGRPPPCGGSHERRDPPRLRPCWRSILPAPRPPPRAKQAPGWMLKGYRAASRLARPAMTPMLCYRCDKGKEDGERLGERFGESGVARPDGPLWWFHAASVGETIAILPLLERLRVRRAPTSTCCSPPSP